jgi:Transposase DDE domain
VFVRVKSTPNSPRRSVQVVESSRVGERVSQRIVRHIGIALDEAEETKLRSMAQEFIERELAQRLNGDSLFAVDAVRRAPGRPKRQTLESVAPPEDVRLGDLVEVSRRVEGPHEVLGHLFDYLHFDRVLDGRGSAMLRDLVIARVMAPASKRGSAAELDKHYGRSHSLDSLYRLMDSLHERLDVLKQIVLEATSSLVGGSVQMMLFDVTTLYFESVHADELRAFGYSKDQKYHCTQVVLALATDSDGLPIGYELFAGNTAEVGTLLACMQRWQRSLNIDKVSFVADRALCSRANLAALEAAPWPYVVAMPLRRSLKAAQQALVLGTALAAPMEIEGELVWTREFDWEGRRLVVSYSSKRAHKDRADRQALVQRLQAKLGKSNPPRVDKRTGEIKPPKANAAKLISNSGYLRYVEQADAGGVFVLDEDKIESDAAWDGLHAIVTNDRQASAAELLARYRRLWVIEESFRTLKHSLAVRPIYHFKPERIAAHIGLCYLAFALTRHAQQRILLAQQAMSVERIRAALHGVQASILEHKRTHAKYRLPSAFGHDAARIYKAFGLKRELAPSVDLG